MTMAKRILVINPNSTEEVTREMDAALAGLRFAGGPVVDCVTLAEGPSGIESQADSDGVIAPLCRLIERASNDADAFVIACFSDPGVHAAREIGAGPVFGIAECGVLCAMTLGDRIGVISILERSVPRHARQFRALGVDGRIAGDSPINLGVVALGDEGVTLDRMTAVGTRTARRTGRRRLGDGLRRHGALPRAPGAGNRTARRRPDAGGRRLRHRRRRAGLPAVYRRPVGLNPPVAAHCGPGAGRAGSGKSHGRNRPRPRLAMTVPSSTTTSPREITVTGQPRSSMPS